jgi:hypothetical protein
VRKIVVYELLSLDGVAEEPDSFFADWDDAMDANLPNAFGGEDVLAGTARLGAERGMLAFSVAFEGWIKANDDEPFPPFADAALGDLQARAAELVLPSRLSA